MPRLVPRTTLPMLRFAEQAYPRWRDHAGTLGLSSAQLARFAADLNQASDAVAERRRVETQLRAAVRAARQAERSLRARLSGLLQAIRARAASAKDPGQVYAAAQVPPERPRSPRPAPGTPARFRMELSQDGVITFRWACDTRDAPGAVYKVERRAVGGSHGGPGPWECLGITGTRRFSDETLPAYPIPPRLEYRITPQRGKVVGTPAIFGVSLAPTMASATAPVSGAGLEPAHPRRSVRPVDRAA